MKEHPMWEAGCSALSWSTQDGKHLFARNMDFTGMAPGTSVTFAPCGSAYELCSGQPSGYRAQYAAVGIGLMAGQPILYEGVNEHGLMGAQLYYRCFAHYPDAARPDTKPIQPPMLVYHLLAQCQSVHEAAEMLEHDLTLVSVPMMGAVPTLHWMFSDRTGESMVVESDADGLYIYREMCIRDSQIVGRALEKG